VKIQGFIFKTFHFWLKNAIIKNMKEFIKKNLVLIIAFALPVLLIFFIAISAYLPSFFISTDYNFIYSACTDGSGSNYYRCDDYLKKRYSVVDGKIVMNDIGSSQDTDKDGMPDVHENFIARIFLHDTQKNESREITIKEAEKFLLSGLLTSPDGVTISNKYEYRTDFFPFFNGRSSYGHYLTKGRSRAKLNLINSGNRYYYQNNFQFIGWLLP